MLSEENYVAIYPFLGRRFLGLIGIFSTIRNIMFDTIASLFSNSKISLLFSKISATMLVIILSEALIYAFIFVGHWSLFLYSVDSGGHINITDRASILNLNLQKDYKNETEDFIKFNSGESDISESSNNIACQLLTICIANIWQATCKVVCRYLANGFLCRTQA